MSDLRGGPTSGGTTARVQNGGSRAAGGSVPARAMTPTEVMKRRRERQEQKEQEERDNQRGEWRPGVAVNEGKLEETSANRRPSAARRSEDVVNTSNFASTKRADKSSVVTTTLPTNLRTPAQTGNNRQQEQQKASRPVTENSNLPQPVRSRAASSSQAQPRPVQPQNSRAASATYTTRQQPSQTRLPSQAAGTTQAQGPSAAPSFQRAQNTQASANQSRNGNSSSFPHAFERWETLSSHWEGLTSFWMKRLEGNSEELKGQPLNQQLARQVTDLSAAGANLFHAVVELQRLRASSERKFQRWFFETRSELVETRERIAQLEAELAEEKIARAEQVTAGAQLEAEKASTEEMNRVTRRADQRINEMKRELQISREEARRGWEEIGRMEQAERDRTFSLKRGEPTLVGGVQVVPMPQGGASRQTSTSRGYATGGLSSHPVQPGDGVEGEGGFTAFDPTRSDTDTDPFTDRGREPAPEVPKIPSSMQAQEQTSATSSAALQSTRAIAGSSTSGQQTGMYATSRPPVAASSPAHLQNYMDQHATDSASFYQHHGSGTSLHGDELQMPPRTTEADERSYVQSADDTISEDDYELDSQGQIRRDPNGNPILHQRHPHRGGPGSEDSDEYNVIDQLQRDHVLHQRYGGPAGAGVGGGYAPTSGDPNVPPGGRPGYAGTSNGQMYSAGQPADYTGAGYQGSGWETVVPRHHHPTRLSDVLEEDERSRTSPSRASERSRVLH